MNYLDLENSFKIYLSKVRKVNPRTIKNYLSDFRHFWQWLKLKSLAKENQVLSPLLIITKIDFSVLENYKKYLSANKIAKSTTKRRLATIRVFCQFCLNQHWITKNPALGLTNPTNTTPKEKEINDLISKFGAYLKSQGSSKNTVKNYTADVRQYLLARSKEQV